MLITADTIIAARKYVQAQEAKDEQQDFTQALLGTAGLRPTHVKRWIEGAILRVEWCACDPCPNPKAIQCAACGLPPYWPEEVGDE